MAYNSTFLSTLLTTSRHHHNASSDIPLTVNEALSGAFGSISLACWLFLLLPQLIENYRNQSAEAISLPFMFIWFVGDVCNLGGGLWADLVPVVVAIGGYFCIADFIMIGQCLYYGIRNRRREGRGLLDSVKELGTQTVSEAEGEGSAARRRSTITRNSTEAAVIGGEEDYDEEQPLLSRTRSRPSRQHSLTAPPGSQAELLGTRRRRSSAKSDRSNLSSSNAQRRRSSHAADNHLVKILEESDPDSGARSWLKNIISIFTVVAIGVAGWGLAYQSGAWSPSAPPTNGQGGEDSVEHMAKGAQVLGYASAVLYLTARIPQIVKNYKDQSCEGLSLLFFILSLMGNLTYGAGILCHSLQKEYVIKNVPWLIGSLGTMAEDIIIFVQFHLYRDDEAAQENAIE